MKKYHIIIVLLMTVSLFGCAKTSEDPKVTLSSTETSINVPQTQSNYEDNTVSVTQSPTMAPDSDANFVRVTDYIPSAAVQLKYATTDNFTGRAIYGFQEAYLRYGTVKKLMQVSDELAQQGLYIKIWDAFRPYSAQIMLWEICPDGNFVSNPQTGSNSHSRGRTVDVTLVDSEGNELEMPSEYDEFSPSADRDYSDCNDAAARNALILQETMEKYGFTGYQKEWWHYSDTNEYPVDKVFDPAFIARWYADCKEYISLRAEPNIEASVLTRIPAEEEMTLLGWDGDFAFVNFQGKQGYVMGSYIKPVDQTEKPFQETPGSIGRPATKELEFYPGREPETMNLSLHIGYGYSIYVPNEGWVLTQTSRSDDAPMLEDTWTSAVSKDAELKVAYYANQSLEETRSLILMREKDYDLTESKQGGLLGISKDKTKSMDINLYELGSGVMAVSFHYRMEDAEQLGTQLSVLADTFAVTEYFWETLTP